MYIEHHHITCHEKAEGRGIAVSFFNLGARYGQVPRPDRCNPVKDPVTFVQEAGWALGQVWTSAQNLASTGIRSPDSPSHSEDYAMEKHKEKRVGAV